MAKPLIAYSNVPAFKEWPTNLNHYFKLCICVSKCLKEELARAIFRLLVIKNSYITKKLKNKAV